MKRSNSYEMDVTDERKGVMEGGEERGTMSAARVCGSGRDVREREGGWGETRGDY
jgi:hypothetical protein